MMGWFFIEESNQEKLVREKYSDALLSKARFFLPDGGVLYRDAKDRKVKLPRKVRYRGIILGMMVLPFCLVVASSFQRNQVSHAKSKTVPSLSQTKNEGKITPTPTESPKLKIPEKFTREVQPRKEPPSKKLVKSKKKVHPKRKRTQKSKKESKMSSKSLKKIQQRIQKVFLKGDFEKVERMMQKVSKAHAGKTPRELWELEAELAYAKCGAARRRKKWKIAVRECEKASSKQLHARAQAVLEELGERAEKTYLEGYVMEGTNRRAALRRYRDAFAMAPTGHPYKEKARQKLTSFKR